MGLGLGLGLDSLSHFSSPSSHHPPFTHYPFPLRSLVCGGQPSPHKPRLVVSHSTCPPLSSSPHAHSFVIGPAVINTHIFTRSDPSKNPQKSQSDRKYKAERWARCALGHLHPPSESLRSPLQFLELTGLADMMIFTVNSQNSSAKRRVSWQR